MTIRMRDLAQSNYAPPSIFARPFARSTELGGGQLLAEAEQSALMEISRVVEFRRNAVIYAEAASRALL